MYVYISRNLLLFWLFKNLRSFQIHTLYKSIHFFEKFKIINLIGVIYKTFF